MICDTNTRGLQKLKASTTNYVFLPSRLKQSRKELNAFPTGTVEKDTTTTITTTTTTTTASTTLTTTYALLLLLLLRIRLHTISCSAAAKEPTNCSNRRHHQRLQNFAERTALRRRDEG